MHKMPNRGTSICFKPKQAVPIEIEKFMSLGYWLNSVVVIAAVRWHQQAKDIIQVKYLLYLMHRCQHLSETIATILCSNQLAS